MTDTTDKLSLQQLKDVRELCLPHTAWRSIIDELISARDQLEAERQRADDNSAECQRQASKVGRIKHELNKAEAEIAALKSAHGNMVTRCALLRQRSDLPVDRIPAYDSLVKAQDEIAALKAKLANPVVLRKVIEPDDVDSILDPTANPDEYAKCVGSDMWNAAMAFAVRSIHKSGFTVKGDL